jgi:hypothetical protein
VILLVTQMILRITRGDALGAERACEAVIASDHRGRAQRLV